MPAMKVLDGDGNPIYIFVNSGTGAVNDPFIPGSAEASEGTQKRPLSRYVDTVGDGSGSTNMGVDGSITPVVFKIAPPAGTIYRLALAILSVRDTGTFDSGGWGNQTDPLDNGWQAAFDIGGVVSPTPVVQSHIDIAARTNGLKHYDFGAGDEFITAIWQFTNMGQFIRLVGDDGDEFRVTINDDMEYLVDQKVLVQGYVE